MLPLWADLRATSMRYKVLILALLAACSVRCQKADEDEERCNENCTVEEKPMPQMVDSMEFAGRMVRFDNWDMRERMEREMISFATSHQTSILILKKAPRYLPEIRKILREEGIPEDFVYLCVIECNLNATAKSGVGAAGFWQFMESTAREYHLEVNDCIDERYNIEKSTRAACKYLKNSYARFGDWMAVAASYNAGMGRIHGELEKQRVDDIFDLWLNNETSRYLFRLLAAKMMIETPENFGFGNIGECYKPIDTEIIEVTCDIADLTVWAKEHGTTYRMVRLLNPWLKGRRLCNKSGKRYKVAIPAKN